MDKTLIKSDISRKILETRRQAEELKAQLQNLIESGINSSLDYKTTIHSHLDKENVKESQNKVQIVKSYDTAHSKHIIKPSSSKTNLSENKDVKLDIKEENSPKKTRSYDVNKAREYIKKQKEKRLEQQKLQNEEKKRAELQKQKLQELHKKSLELVTKNVQAKRERSKSREHTDFIRPIKEIQRSRSSSQEKNRMVTSRSNSKENYRKRGKSGDKTGNVQIENDPINPNLLYPPLPSYILKAQEDKSKVINKKSPVSHNKITIISGNSSDKKMEFSKSDPKNTISSHKYKSLKPTNLFDIPKSKSQILQLEQEQKSANSFYPSVQNDHSGVQLQSADSNYVKESIVSPDKPKEIKFISDKSINGKVGVTKSNSNIDGDRKPLEPSNLVKISDLVSDKASSENKATNMNFISNILTYKSTKNENGELNLQSPENANLVSKNLNKDNFNSLGKPKISEIAIGTHNLEKITKETQTNDEAKQEFPAWLREKRFESNPLNFMNSVKRKLQNAINSPKVPVVDIGVQSSFAQENFKPGMKNKEEIFETIRTAESNKKSDLKSFISHKCLNLDQKIIDNMELIPKKFSSRNLTITKASESDSESDTSKNIPEISSESGTSLKKNAESVQQNGNMGLDVEKLSSLKLRPHIVNNDTHTIQSEEKQAKATFQPHSDALSGKSIKLSSNVLMNFKPQTQISGNKTSFTDNQYTSDFQFSSESVSTSNSPTQNGNTVNTINENVNSQILTDPKLFSEKHSYSIPEITEIHSKNSTTNISVNNESENNFKGSSRNITIRKNRLGTNISQNASSRSNELKNHTDITENVNSIGNGSENKKIESSIPTETESQETNKNSTRSHSREQKSAISSKNSDKYVSLCSNSHPSETVTQMLSKSDSNLQYINTQRGSRGTSESSRLTDIPPLKEPTLSLAITNERVKGKVTSREDRRDRLLKNICVRSDTNKIADLNNTNEIHLKFEAEIHLLNDFNESLRQFSEVEKAFNSLKSINDMNVAASKVLQNRDTQTSVASKSSTATKALENSIVDDKSEFSTINYSRGFLVDADSSSINLNNNISKLDDTKSEDLFNVNLDNSLSNFENLQSHNFAGMTLRMFEQLIKDEDVRLENLKTILKIREQALLDRTKGELAWLEIQRKHLRETGKLQEASLIKKKQRGILVNHQKERHEMQRLKQMQKAASIERKIILKEQRNLIKHQLSTDTMLSKIKVNAPRERRLSGPLKVIQSHTESIRSETSFSRRSSSDRDKEVHSIMSHTQSIVSMVSEVSGDEVMRKEGTSTADLTDLAVKLPSETGGVPISQMKRTLLIREAALQKRRKAAEELLQWHRKLLEEEKRITELESTANTIISQIPNNTMSASPDVAEKYQFKGKQLNQLWFNLTGCKEKKFSENKVYPMSQIALERFCKSARDYSTKKKLLKRVSDSEVSEISEIRTDDSINENIPHQNVIHSTSIRTESEQSQKSSSKNESVPVTTANDYTSDFDIESLPDIVNIEDMDVVDKSINQLIDNFSKIQDDISSLSIKQSLKPSIDLEPEDSVRSEKTDSDIEVSVIETTKENPTEELELELKEKKISSSSKTSTLQDIDDFSNNLSKKDEISDIQINKHEDVSKAKSIEEGITTEMPEIVSSVQVASIEKSNVPTSIETKSDRNYGEDKNSFSATYDKIPSIMEENALNIEGKDNLNKSLEILDELSHLESDNSKDIPSYKEITVEDIEIANEGKYNLIKSEEILLRLCQSEDKLSIIAPTDPIQSETKDSLSRNTTPKSEGILLNLQPADDENSNDVPSDPILSKERRDSLPDEDIVCEDKSNVNTDSSENFLLSKKSSAIVEEEFSTENKKSESDNILRSRVENIDLNSEIVCKENLELGGSTSTKEVLKNISEEPTINSAIEEVKDDSSKALSSVEDLVVSGEQENQSIVEQILNYKNVNSTSQNELEYKLMDTVLDSKISEISEDILESHKQKDINEELIDEKCKSDDQESLEEENVAINDAESSKDSSKLTDTEKVLNKLSFTHEDAELIITPEDSKVSVSESSEKESDSKSTISEKISSEKPLTEIQGNSEPSCPVEIEENVSKETVSNALSSVQDTNKSHVATAPENLTTLSKEDINSYEEKELDSLSSSTTASQSSIINEKDDNYTSEKSKSESEEKSPKSGTVDVKKRVSEIMADANQLSRGDKSPKLQDFYTTTYDLVSPANSPELGSPTEEHKFIAAKSIFGTEAEEILRKQLAIEQEIKQITEQQQKEQLPYLFVREIPNKPPPPYTPPSSLPVANVITIIPSSEEIDDITKYSAKILHKAYLSNNLDNISISENTLSLISKNITKECYKFVFDLCRDISKEHYKQFEREVCPAWLQVKRNPRLTVIKPLDVNGLEKHMSKKLKELFGYQKPIRRENAIIKWSRKKRDHVDEILVMESQAEEAQWTNYDKDELLVMNEVTNEIMNMLLKETGEIFSKILSKQTF